MKPDRHRRWWRVAPPAILLLSAMAVLAQPADRDRPLERAGLMLTFEEHFALPVSFADPVSGAGRWKTSYWFGAQGYASSRSYPEAQEVAVDRGYVGIDPFLSDGRSISLLANRNPLPDDPRMGGKRYTSGVLTTETSFAQRYGYFEARITMEAQPGFWPAFWLWSKPGPDSLGNEIDIVEGQTVRQDRTWHSLHLRAKPGGGGRPERVNEIADSTPVANPGIAGPHWYGLLWTPREITWYIDDRPVLRRPNIGFHDPMFLILSNSVGGWEPENQAPTDFPGRLRIDAVRVYQLRQGSD